MCGIQQSHVPSSSLIDSSSTFSTNTSLYSTITNMKVFNLHEAGPASNMKLEDVNTPTNVGDNEVIIETKAISINPAD
jgi:hypothetical protein